MDFLVGSDHYPSYVKMPDGTAHQLGTVVALGHQMSTISIREWNEAAQEIRDSWIDRAVRSLEASHPVQNVASVPIGMDGGL